MFGYGALIADTRVTMQDGRHVDVLQKVHPVARNLAAGFAGSVELGFVMIDDMRRAFDGPHEEMWFPRAAAWGWWRRARRLYRHAPLALQAVGSSVLLVGPNPAPTAPWPVAHCIRMRSPRFEPEFLPRVVWHSIGSGSDSKDAAYFAEGYRQNLFYAQGDVHLGFGGLAMFTASSVAHRLRERPIPSVSDSVVVATVFLNKHEVKTLSSTLYGEDGAVEEHSPGPLATTWEQFRAAVQAMGLDPTASAAQA